MVSAFLFLINTLLWALLLYPIIVLKILVPDPRARRLWNRILVRGGEAWIAGNAWNLRVTQNIRWREQIEAPLKTAGSYIVICNHQSWIDIVVLQTLLNRKIPFLRFFLKFQLIYVPILGGVWWALDYPFMKRYSKEYLEKHPEARGQDLETAQRALEKFRAGSFSILNFLEGTRFTPEKRLEQNSPFQRLLKPKAGGLAAVIQSLKNEPAVHLLDVTIAYPKGAVSFIEMCQGRLEEVDVRVRELPLPSWLYEGSYTQDEAFRERFQAWLFEIWGEKDHFLVRQLGSSPSGAAGHSRLQTRQ
ncbi:MAG: acyltransferase [Bdellovibrionales bacterium]